MIPAGGARATDRLRREVDALARPEGRRVGTPGHDVAVRHLRERLAHGGLEPYGEGYALPYRHGGSDFVNLAAVVPGTDRHVAPVLVGAHYDTAGDWAGADANAAAVVIALEVAARLHDRPPARNVVIALFDAEEAPYFRSVAMGSTWFHARQATAAIHAALVMDLVGHAVPLPGCEDLLFVTGMESDPGLESTIRALPDVDGARLVTALNRYVGDTSDHHVFRMNEVPYLFLSCGHWRHYHRASDTPAALDYPKMVAIADLLEAAVRDVAWRELRGPWEAYDTTETDLSTMRRGFGPLLDALGVPLRSRRDIDRVVAMMRGRVGL